MKEKDLVWTDIDWETAGMIAAEKLYDLANTMVEDAMICESLWSGMSNLQRAIGFHSCQCYDHYLKADIDSAEVAFMALQHLGFAYVSRKSMVVCEYIYDRRLADRRVSSLLAWLVREHYGYHGFSLFTAAYDGMMEFLDTAIFSTFGDEVYFVELAFMLVRSWVIGEVSEEVDIPAMSSPEPEEMRAGFDQGADELIGTTAALLCGVAQSIAHGIEKCLIDKTGSEGTAHLVDRQGGVDTQP